MKSALEVELELATLLANKTKIFTIAFFLVIFSQNSFAQTGISASSFSGFGLSYNHSFSEILQTKLTTLFFDGSEEENGKESDDFLLTLGLEIQFNFFKSEALRLYGLFGGSFFLMDFGENEEEEPFGFLTNGIGIGIEFPLPQKMRMNFDLGYTSYKILTNPKDFSGLGIGIGFSYDF